MAYEYYGDLIHVSDETETERERRERERREREEIERRKRGFRDGNGNTRRLLLPIGALILLSILGVAAWIVIHRVPLPNDSVVFIKHKTVDGKGRAAGTGVIISENGYLLTNAHVVGASAKEGDSVDVTFRSGTNDFSPAEAVIKKIGKYFATNNVQDDWAVLKADYKTPKIPIDESQPSDLKPGDDLWILGFPQNSVDTWVQSDRPKAGATLETTRGNVAAFMPNEASPTELDFDANTQTGNSGSPVMNARGEMVALNHGLTPADPSGRQKNVSIPIFLLKKEIPVHIPGWN